MQSAIQIKVKVTLLALNVQIKNALKNEQKEFNVIAFRMQLHHLLVVVVVSDVKVMSSTVAVIFVVN